jgi:subtilisin family serine protease
VLIDRSLETWSGGLLKKTHEFLKELRKDSKYSTRAKDRRRVRIALLDTGIDMTHPDISARSDRIIETFCEIKGLENKGNEDKSGHGTHAALLLLKVAPEADIYVARVFKDTSNVIDTHVGPAITHAVNTWQVDIISMSFGFPSWISHISDALTTAAANNVVMFASASNEGGNTTIPKAWPARDDRVFCIHATDSAGNSYKYNPPRTFEYANFATLGENVLSAWRRKETQAKSGTSIATPIAAATAALFIDFSRLPKLRNQQPIRHLPQVASFQGIKALLLASSLKTGEQNFRYIKPWHIFEKKEFEYTRVGFKIEGALQNYFGVGS